MRMATGIIFMRGISYFVPLNSQSQDDKGTRFKWARHLVKWKIVGVLTIILDFKYAKKKDTSGSSKCRRKDDHNTS